MSEEFEIILILLVFFYHVLMTKSAKTLLFSKSVNNFKWNGGIPDVIMMKPIPLARRLSTYRSVNDEQYNVNQVNDRSTLHSGNEITVMGKREAESIYDFIAHIRRCLGCTNFAWKGTGKQSKCIHNHRCLGSKTIVKPLIQYCVGLRWKCHRETRIVQAR